MPCKARVELSHAVCRDLGTGRFSEDERDSFVARVEQVRAEPIKRSEGLHDPAISKYMLRFFRFGSNDRWLAVFAFDAHKNRIRVIECRLSRPRA